MTVAMLVYQYERQPMFSDEYSYDFVRPNGDKQTMKLA